MGEMDIPHLGEMDIVLSADVAEEILLYAEFIVGILV